MKFPYSVRVNAYFYSEESEDMVNWCYSNLGLYNVGWRRKRDFRVDDITANIFSRHRDEPGYNFFFKDQSDQMKFSLRFS